MVKTAQAGSVDAPLPPAPLVDVWLDHLRIERRRSANTVDSYARDLEHLRRFAAGQSRVLETLDRQALEAFVRELMGRGLSPRSVARVVSSSGQLSETTSARLSSSSSVTLAAQRAAIVASSR